MYQSFSDFINDVKSSGKDWIKSQIKVSALTFLMLFIGLNIVDIWFYPIAWKILIPFIALFIAIVDAIPVIGISVIMLPWAAIDAIFIEKDAGFALLILYIIIMVAKQIMEPFIRGKSLGVSPLEEAIAAIVGWFVIPKVGIIIGPLLYTVGKKVYLKTKPQSYFDKVNTNYVSDNKQQKKDDFVDITDEVEDVDE